jgi:hypothetical protein
MTSTFSSNNKNVFMMKNILAILGLMLLTWSVQAQNDIRFGFQLSPSISWLTTDDVRINPNGPNLGLQLGMIGEYYFRENYSLSTGIGFHFNAGGKLFYEESVDTVSIWSGAEIPGGGDYQGGTDFKYSIQYVEIPIGLKLRTKEFGYIRYYVEPRIALGFRTQAKGNILNDAVVDSKEDYNIQSAVNPINLSWGIGGGLEYTVSTNTAIFGGLSLQNGFTDVTKDKNTNIKYTDSRGNKVSKEEDSKAKLISITLRLGVMF